MTKATISIIIPAIKKIIEAVKRESNLEKGLSKELVKTFDYYGNQVLGLFSETSTDESSQAAIESLIVKRDAAREAKNWAESDSIRDELSEMGIELQDTPDGTKWRRI